MKKKLVVIGNGMAGMRALEELLDLAPNNYDVTVFGAEPHVNYNRIMLSPVLAREQAFEDIIINDLAWYEDNNICLRAHEKIVAINRSNKTIISDQDRITPYDILWLATGSDPFIIPIPGKDLKGVTTFRDMSDVTTMIDASETYQNAVVIGGGLLGLEAAYGLKKNGMKVTVIHLADTLMERQLDEAAGFLLKSELESRDITILTGANTGALVGKDRVESVQLKDGTEIPADLVVMAVGIRPNMTLARAAGLECNRGVVVNDHLQTSDPDIFAVGECVEHNGLTYGLVSPLYEMGRAMAGYMVGHGSRYKGSVTSTKLKVTGVELFSAGDFNGGPDCEDIVFRDARRGVYKRLVIKDDRIVGAVLYGDAADGPWYFQLMKDKDKIADIRDYMIFGQALAMGDNAADPMAAVTALPDKAEICGCNGVCKGAITSAILTKGLTSLDEVRAHTKASASCGSCTHLVEQVMALTLGDSYQAPTATPMCGCTDHTHDDVRHLILHHQLKEIPAVMQMLQWKTPNGCSKCRPALNYYLIAAWPGEYQDDYQSRYINERVHANIQKDGTYSVVPRMWGGLTTPNELRAIADVTDKFNIPTVKVTGGQRIDLLGVKKEDLPGVWADLNAAGMVSGHAYGKSLRTVKTCVGQEWCRFGTQMSMGMGVDLERMAWGSWTPHKFKMAVSGCPRNCAEATIKDFGVVAVDSGWELHVGGNGGMHVRACDLLCKVTTDAEVKEYCAAFMQLYREEGHYLERTAPWVERVGLDSIKQRIVEDAENRANLAKRFHISQQGNQQDPWAERAKHNVHAHEFKPLADVG
ncbi:nitrite reductase large subunit NirB [Paremcibacter congregatus]|uniref:Nitrite reductase large subunit n=1 Tax=Paremcibacter congregatus TaxID=2043170 RepID=A0A2G4YS09_9PROT|nr:nitrite reductase large subunit NirB [Paremcibacter congregatus]PHZ85129.1 nitrite reductase large subunit [Paremcibacter congregatus]QDE27934.1 NAD(P)/FAD-dependent oxidoreductase [Paremcibacter congregatus]